MTKTISVAATAAQLSSWAARSMPTRRSRCRETGLQKNEYFIMGATGSNDMAQPQMTPLMNELRKYDHFIETSDLSQGNFFYMVVDGKEHW
ncbi:MAG: hypothetical protein VZR73_08085 [Acutalibacteraceae bacterium]|nr:hypothetical protein [Acutalibacteraceae bacterium]